jgi:putative endonuclease
VKKIMYFVYALFYKSGDRIYVGMTKNTGDRIRNHERGKTRSTKNRGKFIVKIIEECPDRMKAREREKYWKSGCGKEKLKILYSGVEQSGSSGGS